MLSRIWGWKVFSRKTILGIVVVVYSKRDHDELEEAEANDDTSPLLKRVQSNYPFPFIPEK